MDVLLSIPVLSYFLSPSTAPWSTSLNLIFFYMTWSTLLLSHSAATVHLLGVVAIRLLLFLLPALVFLLFDLCVPTLAEGIKHGGRSALPSRDARMLSRQLILVLINLTLLTAAEYGLGAAYALLSGGTTELRVSTTLPLPWQVFKHVGILLTARGVLHYYLHRYVLHGRGTATGLRYLADRHRGCAHARRATPYSLQLMADHPVPLLLDQLVCGYAPAVALRPHLLTYFLFVGICTVEQTLAMSGYTTVPGFVMGGMARRTAAHYAGGGAGNFGYLGVLDWVNGTGEGVETAQEEKKSPGRKRTKA